MRNLNLKDISEYAYETFVSNVADNIEDVLEPYLIQQGYLMRTPRGRVATQQAYQHFGLPVPKALATGDLWTSES